MVSQGLPNRTTRSQHPSLSATTAPASPAALSYRTTEQEQQDWWLRRYWRRMRTLAACPPRRTLESMMRANRASIGR